MNSLCLKTQEELGVVAQVCNPRTLGAEGGVSVEFKAKHSRFQAKQGCLQKREKRPAFCNDFTFMCK